MRRLVVNLYGPPGTGKTTVLTGIFILAVQSAGPESVAAVTYTRAAAAELRGRAAHALGIRRHEQAALPFVGTIHSLCYRLLGGAGGVRLVDEDGAFDAFCRERGIQGAGPGALDPESTEAFWFGDDVGALQEAEAMRRLLASARHRLVSLGEAAQDLPLERLGGLSPSRLEWLATQYTAWKQREGRLDFEDLLEEGMRRPLPVAALLIDECQDNSRLMWRVLHAWGSRCPLVLRAGDPWQAIYRFCGADPHLFTSQPGRWLRLGDSHRLSAEAAAYAQRVLASAGWRDERFLGTWSGRGGVARGDTRLYLARTRHLVRDLEADLLATGEPFLRLYGRSPWASRAGDAYRVFTRLLGGGLVPRASVGAALSALPAGALPRGARAGWRARGGKEGLDLEAVQTELGRSLAQLRDALPHADYFRRVEARYGIRGLMLTPRTLVGTIHSAKGREADEVLVSRSWAWRPSRSLLSAGGMLSEACVAYVAVTRHRGRLELLPSVPGQGADYPWPA